MLGTTMIRGLYEREELDFREIEIERGTRQGSRSARRWRVKKGWVEGGKN